MTTLTIPPIFLDHTNHSTASPDRAVGIAWAKAHLSELVEQARAGEEIVLTRNGTPQARLVPLEEPIERKPGRGAGKWHFKPDQ
ncbi:MAG TPA: type II toxin-antitoxin system prevent-host-death family antitoxin [Gemmatimonadales bacterium]|nr:type II toxin-antitoxin system prevent-host-death family antitoxin [Gemmatimonadales bacterium]